MDTRVKEILSAVLFLALSVFLYFSTLNIKSMTNMGVGPDFAPKLVAIGMFVLSLALLIKEIRNWYIAKNSNENHPSKEKRIILDPNFKNKYKNALITTVLIGLYVFAIPIIGFLISTIVYLIIQFCLLGEKKYWNKPLFLILSLVVANVIYFTFRLGFEVRLPAGIFF